MEEASSTGWRQEWNTRATWSTVFQKPLPIHREEPLTIDLNMNEYSIQGTLTFTPIIHVKFWNLFTLWAGLDASIFLTIEPKEQCPPLLVTEDGDGPGFQFEYDMNFSYGLDKFSIPASLPSIGGMSVPGTPWTPDPVVVISRQPIHCPLCSGCLATLGEKMALPFIPAKENPAVEHDPNDGYIYVKAVSATGLPSYDPW